MKRVSDVRHIARPAALATLLLVVAAVTGQDAVMAQGAAMAQGAVMAQDKTVQDQGAQGQAAHDQNAQ
jgi:hypothetical protein